MSYTCIIYMTLPKECSVCYEAFIMPDSIEDSISCYKREVLDKTDDYMKTNMITQDSKRKRIITHFLKKYYQKLWYPHYKQYKCSTENCNTAICGECISELEYKSDSIVFKCTHCRLYDWKNYMTKFVFPEMIMIYLSKRSIKKIFKPKHYYDIVFLI